MNTNKLISLIIVLFNLVLISSQVNAVTFQLRAAVKNLTLPDGTKVPMWGFGLKGSPITIPGPLLEVPPGDNTLTIKLTNKLPQPVSIVIPGQMTTMTPVKFTDAQGRQRVRAFTQETATDQTQTYTWNNMRPGTYVYHSGTQPAVQVQMGLYGGVKKDVASNQAYSGIAYDHEVILFYSEIDPYLHRMVKRGKYGPGKQLTSTINYQPKYFLVNGQPYSPSQTPLPAGIQGETTLIRFINMGLKTHVPTLNGLYLRIIAEDGNLYPYPREQYTIMLAAGKTKDALLTSAPAGVYAVYDRRLNLTNDKSPGGGMLTYLDISEPPQAVGNSTSSSVSIVQTKYKSKNNLLLVKASTDSDPDTVTLVAEANFGNTTEPLGTLLYIDSKGFYRKYFSNITSAPDSITVTIWPINGEMSSISNNTDTKPVPFKQ